MTDYHTEFHHRGRVLPNELRESLDRYAEHGVPPGDFLQAVLANDLFEACGRADDNNVWLIPVICAYVYNELPSSCWGDRAKVKKWIERHEQRRREWASNAPLDEHGREA
jgi:hypothetical protein